VTIYFNGGFIYFFILSLLSYSINTIFSIYAGILTLLFFVVVCLWPHKKLTPATYLALEGSKGTWLLRFKEAFNRNFLFNCVFVLLVLVKGYLFWNFIEKETIDIDIPQFLSKYGIKMLSQVGGLLTAITSLLSVFLTLLGLYSTSITVHIALITGWALLECLCGLLASFHYALHLIRFISFGFYMPYIFGFWFSFLFQNDWNFFGMTLSFNSLLITIIFLLIYIFSDQVFLYRKNIEIILSCAFGLIMLYPIIVHFLRFSCN